jgi:DNA-binding winged helix-turn-helix (wHTH) protein/TolB-like protein
MRHAELPTVAFGDFEFTPSSGELRRGDVINRLAPQAAAVLAMLVERRGDVVTRAELRDKLWPETTVEFDQGLNFCIRQLRIALSDDAADPKYIETLHRRGYRLVAAIRGAVELQPAPPAIVAKRSRRPLFATLGVMGFAAVVVAFISSRPPVPQPRLAVLAFDVRSADSSLTVYRRQLVEALVAASDRGQLDKIAVMGPSFTSRFAGMSTPPDSIRAALGATHVLSGGLERRGDSTRVFTQLIRTSDRRHLYAARFFDASNASQIATIADSIARAVATILAREHL